MTDFQSSSSSSSDEQTRSEDSPSDNSAQMNSGRQELYRIVILTPLFAMERNGIIVAHWVGLKWKTYEILGNAIAPLVEELAALSPDSIRPEEGVASPIDNESILSISYLLDEPVQKEQRIEIETAIRTFCGMVLESSESGDIFTACSLTGTQQQIVINHATRFLEKNHDKHIATPFLIELQSGGQIVCNGAFRHKLATNPIPETRPSNWLGKIVTLWIELNCIQIALDDGEKQKLFLKTDHQLRQCCDSARDGVINVYTSQVRPSAGGETIDVVIDIKPAEPDPDLFSDSR